MSDHGRGEAAKADRAGESIALWGVFIVERETLIKTSIQAIAGPREH